MLPLLDTLRRPRRLVLIGAVAGALVIGSGAAASIHAATGSHDEARSVADQRAAELAESEATKDAEAERATLAAGRDLAERLEAALQASDGTVDEGLRTRTVSTLTALEDALAARDHQAVRAALPPARTALRELADAIEAHEVTAAREAAEAEAARVAAEQEAQRLADEEAARVLAQQEADRVAAAEAARVAAARTPAPAPAQQPAAPQPAPTVALAGTFTVTGWSLPGARNATLIIDESTGTCVPTFGYDDIGPGAAVTIYDERGTVVAATTLGSAQLTVIERHEGDLAPTGLVADCSFGFSAAVPDRPFYQVEVTHRGRMTFSRAEIGSIQMGL